MCISEFKCISPVCVLCRLTLEWEYQSPVFLSDVVYITQFIISSIDMSIKVSTWPKFEGSSFIRYFCQLNKWRISFLINETTQFRKFLFKKIVILLYEALTLTFWWNFSVKTKVFADCAQATCFNRLSRKPLEHKISNQIALPLYLLLIPYKTYFTSLVPC